MDCGPERLSRRVEINFVRLDDPYADEIHEKNAGDSKRD